MKQIGKLRILGTGVFAGALVALLAMSGCGNCKDCPTCKDCPNPPGGTKSLITKTGNCATTADCPWPSANNPLYNKVIAPTCVNMRCRADLKPTYQCVPGLTTKCPDGVNLQTCDDNGAWQGCL